MSASAALILQVGSPQHSLQYPGTQAALLRVLARQSTLYSDICQPVKLRSKGSKMTTQLVGLQRRTLFYYLPISYLHTDTIDYVVDNVNQMGT